jgi:hypothetical protein
MKLLGDATIRSDDGHEEVQVIKTAHVAKGLIVIMYRNLEQSRCN